MDRRHTSTYLMLAAIPAAAHAAAPRSSLPFQFQSSSLLPLLVLAVAPPTVAQPPSLLTRDIELLGEDCTLAKWGNDDVWTYEGNTADGRPYYHNEGLVALTGTKNGDFYIYYDANCDGKTGAAHSKNGYPQWVMSRYKPSLTREYDLEDDGTCVGDIAEAAGYSRQATWDWTFTMGVQAVACPHAFGDPDWDTSVAHGGLIGCPEPQPFYTLKWSEWTSTDEKECGGAEVRMQIEVCKDTSPKKDCPCTGRRDPALLQRETRENTCVTTTSTTSTTTTTTKRQTTTSSSSSPSSSSSLTFIAGTTSKMTTVAATVHSTSDVSIRTTSAQPVVQAPSLTTSRPVSTSTQDGTPSDIEGGGEEQTSVNQDNNTRGVGGEGGTHPAASEDGKGDGTDANGGGRMSGGTVAVLIMGVLVVVGVIVAIVLQRKSHHGATQQQNQPPTTAFSNQMFDTSIGQAGRGGSSQGQLPSGAFVASTLDMKAQRRHLARNNNPNFRDYSTPNIPTAAELQARAAGGAAASVGSSIGGGGGACSSSITYATAAPAGPSDAYDGVTYNSMPLRSNANANMNDNAGVQYRPIYDTNGKHDNAGVQYRPIYGTNGKHDNAGVQYRPIYDTNGKHDNAGVQYRPIYDTSANGGGQDDGRGGGVNGGSSTYKTVGAAAAAPAVPANTNNYAQPLSKSNRPTPHAPTLPVRRATKRAKCERPSPKGGTCKTPQRDGSHFCTPHACPADGCGASKSSSEEYCPLHATSGSGSGSSGISRKARDGSTYDGFGGAGNVDHYGSSAESSKGVVHGQETVYAGFNEDEEV